MPVGAARPLGRAPPALALGWIGLPISFYRAVLGRLPALEGGLCDPSTPCTIIWVPRFGSLTIPARAATAPTLVAAPLLLVQTPASPSTGRAPCPLEVA